MKEIKNSSNIAKVGHADGKLTIEYKNGGVYDYADVPEDVHHELMKIHDEGGSVGKFVHRFIKPIYEAKKREDEK